MSVEMARSRRQFRLFCGGRAKCRAQRWTSHDESRRCYPLHVGVDPRRARYRDCAVCAPRAMRERAVARRCVARLVVVSNRVPLPSERGPQAGGLAVALADALRPGSLWFGWSGRRSGRATAEPRTATGGRHRPTRRSTFRGGIPLVLCQFRQRRAVAAAAFPARPGRLPARGLRGLSHRQPAFRRGAAAVAAPRRSDLGARLSPVPAGRGIAPRWACAIASASSCTRRSCRLPCSTRCRARRSCCLRCAPTTWWDFIPGPIGRRSWTACARSSACTRTGEGRFMHSGPARAGHRRSRSASMPMVLPTARRTRRDSAETRRLRESLGGRALAIGVDRLDYSKGLGQPVRGVRPAARANIPSIVARSASCRSPHGRARNQAAYQRLRRELDRIVGDTNGRFSEFDWVPLRYMTRAVRRELLAGFFRHRARRRW